MKIATYNWNVREIGKKIPISYYGYRTKKEALEFVENWNANHTLKLEVVKYINREWVRA